MVSVENEQTENDPRRNWREAGIGRKLRRLEENRVHLIHVQGPHGCCVGLVTSVIDLNKGLVRGIYFDNSFYSEELIQSFWGPYNQDICTTDIMCWHWAEDHEPEKTGVQEMSLCAECGVESLEAGEYWLITCKHNKPAAVKDAS